MDKKTTEKIREITKARRTEFITNLAETLRNKDFNVGIDGWSNNNLIVIDTEGTKVTLKVELQQNGESVWRKPNGRLFYKIDDYTYENSKGTYPEPKKGFNVMKAIERIQDAIAYKKAHDKREQLRKQDAADKREILEKAAKMMDVEVHRYSRSFTQDDIRVKELIHDKVAVSFPVGLDELKAMVAFYNTMKTLNAKEGE